MTLVLAVAVAWSLSSIGAALLIGRFIARADRRMPMVALRPSWPWFAPTPRAAADDLIRAQVRS